MVDLTSTVRETVRERSAAAARAPRDGASCCGPSTVLHLGSGAGAGALTRTEFEQGLAAAGFGDTEITETHRVHDQAGSAIIRARQVSAAPA